MSYQQLIQ